MSTQNKQSADIINFGEKASLYLLTRAQKKFKSWRTTMELTLTTKQALQLNEGVTAFNTLNMPKDKTKLVYKLALIAAALEDLVITYNENRNTMLSEMGKPVDGQPGNYNLEGDNLKAFQQANAQILLTTVSITIGEKIILSELDGIEGIKPQWIKDLLPVMDTNS